jgi:thiamine-phosphate pyrophosphorylase
MAGEEFFGEIDKALCELRDGLFVVRALLRRGKFEERLGQTVDDLFERSGYQERALRPRFGLDSTIKRVPRNEAVAILEQKGIAVEETPQLIVSRLTICQEQARRLEGYFKFFNMPKVSEFYRRLRFESAEISRVVELSAGAPVEQPPPVVTAAPLYQPPLPSSSRGARLQQALRFCPLYFIIDESICGFRDPLRTAYDAVSGGVRIMQLRMKHSSTRELLLLARRLRTICEDRGCLLLINDRIDIALLAGAQGVHFGAEDLDPAEARQLGKELLIGATARTTNEALAAQEAGADYLGCGSVFASKTKPGLPVIGTLGIKTIASATSIPVVAIGGITLENCAPVLRAGAQGVCSVSPFAVRRSVKNLAAQFRKTCRETLGYSEG